MCAFSRSRALTRSGGERCRPAVRGPGPHFFYSRMDFTWIVVGLVGWALALLFVLLVMRMAARQDRAARHGEKKLNPFSDVTITKVEKDAR